MLLEKFQFFLSEFSLPHTHTWLFISFHICDSFRAIKAEIYLRVPPMHVGDVDGFFRKTLNSFIMRWHPRLQGIVLAYSDIRLLSPLGRIIFDQTPVRFSIESSLLVFTPTVGARAAATINQIGWDYIGLSLLGCFPCSVKRGQLKRDWKLRDGFILADNGEREIQLGDRLFIEIHEVVTDHDRQNNDAFHIFGSLLKPWAGLIPDHIDSFTPSIPAAAGVVSSSAARSISLLSPSSLSPSSLSPPSPPPPSDSVIDQECPSPPRRPSKRSEKESSSKKSSEKASKGEKESKKIKKEKESRVKKEKKESKKVEKESKNKPKTKRLRS